MTSIPMLAASSPRFMGEAAFAAGKGAKKVTNMLDSAQNPDEAKNLARMLILNKAQEKEQQK